MSKPWPHPAHFYWAMFGTVFDLLSLVLSFIGVFVAGWFRLKDGSSHALYNTINVTCYMEFCSSFDQDFEDEDTNRSYWVWMTFMTFFIGMILNTVCYILLACVFWPMVLKDYVSTHILKCGVAISIVSAYVKFMGCWVVVHYIPVANTNRIMNQWNADVEINTFPLGFLFAAFVSEMVAVIGLKVAADVGVRGQPTHQRRLEQEREEKMKMQGTPRRNTAYSIDTTKDHQKIIHRISIVIPPVQPEQDPETASLASQASARSKRNV